MFLNFRLVQLISDADEDIVTKESALLSLRTLVEHSELKKVTQTHLSDDEDFILCLHLGDGGTTHPRNNVVLGEKSERSRVFKILLDIPIIFKFSEPHHPFTEDTNSSSDERTQ